MLFKRKNINKAGMGMTLLGYLAWSHTGYTQEISCINLKSNFDSEDSMYKSGLRQGKLVGERLAAALQCNANELFDASTVQIPSQSSSYIHAYLSSFVAAFEQAKLETMYECLQSSNTHMIDELT